jgi:SNF2 family DNA or RNA helicase
VAQLRITAVDSVSLQFFEDEEELPIPSRFRQWAALFDGYGITISGERIALSKSRFLTEIATIRQFRDELGLETTIDEEAALLVNRVRGERASFEKALRGDSTGREKSASELQHLLREVGFKRADSLRDHQLRSIEALAALPHGANFSVPGAGKTTVLLALHELERITEPHLNLLIVAPRNAMGAWDIEIRECLQLPPTIQRLSGGPAGVRKQLGARPRVAIMTYELLRSTFREVAAYLDKVPVHVVLDESHRAKAGYESLQGSAALEIAPSAYRRDIMSGTPMPQRIADICSQMTFVWPFETFCGSLIHESIPNALSEANKVLSPVFTRTTKKELELPPIERVALKPIPMAPYQAEAYRTLRREAGKRFKVFSGDTSARLRALGQQVVTLLQIASNPALAYHRLKAQPYADEIPELIEILRLATEEEIAGKFEALDDVVTRLLNDSEEKVVIWSSFVGTITNIEERFADFGALSIHGAIPTGSESDLAFREARVKRFNEVSAYRVMVANPAAGGEGISLHHRCHNAIYFDRNFNAAQYLQSIDRIHRLGLPADTTTRLWVFEAESSVDQIVSNRLTDKVRAMETVLNDFGIEPLALDEDESDENEAGIDFGDERAIIEHLMGEK